MAFDNHHYRHFLFQFFFFFGWPITNKVCFVKWLANYVTYVANNIETIGIDSMKSHVLVSFNNSCRFIVIFFVCGGGNLSFLFIVGPCSKLVVVDAKLESFLLMNFIALWKWNRVPTHCTFFVGTLSSLVLVIVLFMITFLFHFIFIHKMALWFTTLPLTTRY